jgi:hypothetical protein
VARPRRYAAPSMMPTSSAMRSRSGWQWWHSSAWSGGEGWLSMWSTPFGGGGGEGVVRRYPSGATVNMGEQTGCGKSRMRYVVAVALAVLTVGCAGDGVEGSGAEFLSCVEAQGGTNEAADWCADQLGYRP